MTCEGNVCGTGGWAGPLPGDPSNDINITALPAYGGIDVSFSFPTTNPFALAYGIIFRGLSADFAAALPIANDSDGFYHDRVEPGVIYYYWVQAVSINGTLGAVIGPAWSDAKSSIEGVMRDLTGKIDEGMLAQTLQTSIQGITQNNAAIYQEVQDRLASNAALQAALTAVQGDVDQAMTYILDETNARTTADSAVVNQVNAIAAGVDQNAAAIVEERTVRTTKHDALANTVNTLFVEGGAGYAALIDERALWTDGDNVIADSVTLLSGRVGTTEGAITDIQNLTLSGTSALATKLSTLTTDVGNAASAVQDLDTSLADGTHALASSVKTVESTVNGNTATGQVGLTTQVNNITGALDSMFYAKVSANNLIGGFGVWNNGAYVEAGFDVDSFWVGRTSTDKIKPFIVSGGTTYIDEAAINSLTFSKLRAADGSVIVEGGKLKANYIQAKGLSVTDDQGNLTFLVGLDGKTTLGGAFKRGQTSYDNGTGWFFDIVNGVPVMSIGRGPTGPALLFDGTNVITRGLAIEKLNITIGGSYSSSVANGTQFVGTASVSVTGGVGPYTYNWSVANLISDIDPAEYSYSIESPDSPTTRFKGYAVNNGLAAQLQLVVTDSRGLIGIAYKGHSVHFGAYQ